MEEHSSNGINYLLILKEQHNDYLGQIRHWANLKIAKEGDEVWVKDFTRAQVDSIEVKSIPYKELFELKDNRLFPYGSTLPVKKAPSLLWTPIKRGLPVTTPKLNFNYFGVGDKIDVKLVPADKEMHPFAVMVDLEELGRYIEEAPAIRLQGHTWVIIEPNKALVMGTPLLPLQGEAYWQSKGFLFPLGYGLELEFLTEVIYDKLNPGRNSWVLWGKDGSYAQLQKQNLKPLSRSSYRLSVPGKVNV